MPTYVQNSESHYKLSAARRALPRQSPITQHFKTIWLSELAIYKYNHLYEEIFVIDIDCDLERQTGWLCVCSLQ